VPTLKDWDEKRGRAKAKPGTYLDDVNQVLNHYQDATTGAAHAAKLAGRALDKDTMRADIERCYSCLAQEQYAITNTRVLGSWRVRNLLV